MPRVISSLRSLSSKRLVLGYEPAFGENGDEDEGDEGEAPVPCAREDIGVASPSRQDDIAGQAA